MALVMIHTGQNKEKRKNKCNSTQKVLAIEGMMIFAHVVQYFSLVLLLSNEYSTQIFCLTNILIMTFFIG